MANKEVWASRPFINEKGQAERVELIYDWENPDGFLSSRVHTPKHTRKIITQFIPVRLIPTGEIYFEDPTLDQTEVVISHWKDYSPIEAWNMEEKQD